MIDIIKGFPIVVVGILLCIYLPYYVGYITEIILHKLNKNYYCMLFETESSNARHPNARYCIGFIILLVIIIITIISGMIGAMV